jgi:hypothetical protein
MSVSRSVDTGALRLPGTPAQRPGQRPTAPRAGASAAAACKNAVVRGITIKRRPKTVRRPPAVGRRPLLHAGVGP